MNWAAGDTVPNLVETPISPDGKVTLYNSAGSVDLVVDVQGWNGSVPSAPTEGLFNALNPSRFLDTRDGTGGIRGSIGPGATISFPVVDRAGVPGAGLSAIALNITVTHPSAASYLVAFPAGVGRPATSSLNYVAGKTVANRVIVQPGVSGMVSLYNLAGTVDVIVDVSGWFTDGSSTTTGSRFTTVTPARLLDTRLGFGWVPAGGTGTFQLADTSSLGVTAVVLNVTATRTTGASYLEVWPSGGARPGTSDINYPRGDTVANLVIVKLGANNLVNFYNYTGATDLVADIVGYFGPTG